MFCTGNGIAICCKVWFYCSSMNLHTRNVRYRTVWNKSGSIKRLTTTDIVMWLMTWHGVASYYKKRSRLLRGTDELNFERLNMRLAQKGRYSYNKTKFYLISVYRVSQTNYCQLDKYCLFNSISLEIHSVNDFFFFYDFGIFKFNWILMNFRTLNDLCHFWKLLIVIMWRNV